MVTQRLHAMSPPALEIPKTIAPATNPEKSLLVKNVRMPMAKPMFNTTRNAKKFARSNNQPHSGLNNSLAIFGTYDFALWFFAGASAVVAAAAVAMHLRTVRFP